MEKIWITPGDQLCEKTTRTDALSGLDPPAGKKLTVARARIGPPLKFAR